MIELQETALLVIDVQERLFPKIASKEKIEKVILQAIEAFQVLKVPIIVCEQYPQGLGATLDVFQSKLTPLTPRYGKVSFSALQDTSILKAMDDLQKKSWVLVGIESHICILQTALDLLKHKRQVIVLEDGVGSRNSEHKKIAILEMRKKNIRISCLETLLFELLGHAKHSKFKEISSLLR